MVLPREMPVHHQDDLGIRPHQFLKHLLAGVAGIVGGAGVAVERRHPRLRRWIEIGMGRQDRGQAGVAGDQALGPGDVAVERFELDGEVEESIAPGVEHLRMRPQPAGILQIPAAASIAGRREILLVERRSVRLGVHLRVVVIPDRRRVRDETIGIVGEAPVEEVHRGIGIGPLRRAAARLHDVAEVADKRDVFGDPVGDHPAGLGLERFWVSLRIKLGIGQHGDGEGQGGKREPRFQSLPAGEPEVSHVRPVAMPCSRALLMPTRRPSLSVSIHRPRRQRSAANRATLSAVYEDRVRIGVCSWVDSTAEEPHVA